MGQKYRLQTNGPYSPEILFQREEYATLWHWGFHELLEWNCNFEWLFSPVIGNHDYPGDLWGVDEKGNILIVETKLGAREDPFLDFIEFEKKRRWANPYFVEIIRSRWAVLYQKEMLFWRTYQHDLMEGSFQQVFAPGIVPYSRKRFATRDFSLFYAKNIATKLFNDHSYPKNVDRYLNILQKTGIQTVYYFGFCYVKDFNQPLLSAKGNQNKKELESFSGEKRVILKAITAKDDHSNNSIQIWINSNNPDK
jgi:hypothetical protein